MDDYMKNVLRAISIVFFILLCMILISCKRNNLFTEIPESNNPLAYTVTFDSQGADIAAHPTTKTVTLPVTTIDVLPTPPTRAGYDFAGWNMASNGCGAEFTASTTVTGNIMVYAVWSTVGLAFTPISGTECSVNKGTSNTTLNITIPGTWQGRRVITIEMNAFSGCSTMPGITIPESVTTIGQSAFGNCSALISVTIPSSVTTLGNQAFNQCGLTSLIIPGSVASMGNSAFASCGALTSVTILNGVTTIGNSAFNDCAVLTSVTIPGSVTTIGSGAFYFCSALTSLTIPDSVTFIDNEAFGECTVLTNLSMHSMAPPSLGPIDVFISVTGCVLHIHTGTSGFVGDSFWDTGSGGIFTIVQDL